MLILMKIIKIVAKDVILTATGSITSGDLPTLAHRRSRRDANEGLQVSTWNLQC